MFFFFFVRDLCKFFSTHWCIVRLKKSIREQAVKFHDTTTSRSTSSCEFCSTARQHTESYYLARINRSVLSRKIVLTILFLGWLRPPTEITVAASSFHCSATSGASRSSRIQAAAARHWDRRGATERRSETEGDTELQTEFLRPFPVTELIFIEPVCNFPETAKLPRAADAIRRDCDERKIIKTVEMLVNVSFRHWYSVARCWLLFNTALIHRCHKNDTGFCTCFAITIKFVRITYFFLVLFLG